VHSTGLLRHDPDYIAEKFNVNRFGPSGALLDTMSAEKMIHFPDNEKTEVTEPRLSHFGGSRPIHISAKQGIIGADAREVVLTQDVHVRRVGKSGEPDTELSTSALTIFPDDEVVRTAAPVTLSRGGSVLHGIGLEADNKTAIYKLLSRVSGTIEKSQRP
jgi:lipopolysaccharide export system protein LptC